MRDLLYIVGLMLAMCILAADFPATVATVHDEGYVRVPFASYVELSPSVHAAYLESARTSWQVRSGSRGRPVIGSLDSGVPLLMDTLPSREKVVFRRVDGLDSPVGPIDVDVYSLLPGTEGVNSPRFSAKPQHGAPEGGDKPMAFPDVEMLSVDQFRKLKEIMQ